MRPIHPLNNSYEARLQRTVAQLKWYKFKIDPWLLLALLSLITFGLFVLFSASNQNISLVWHQVFRLILACSLMLLVSHIAPHRLMQWSPWLYAGGLVLLCMVLLFGHSSQGAKRWFSIGPIQIQPSEIMKLAMPMMIAWLYRGYTSAKTLLLALLTLIIPVILTAKQPDLGTAILILCSGCFVLLFTKINKFIIFSIILVVIISLPIGWHLLHAYQQHRILTLLDPSRDPLGAGYNIIQSKIAIGSGGLLGKGWLHGTQAHLAFLPAHTTDFIFAVIAEELGFIGCIFTLFLYVAILLRAFYIAFHAPDNFTRLLAISLSLTFMSCAVINIGMVLGLLPVVGVPLPFISYGGSSIVTLCISFGIIMSIHTHKKLWST